MKKSGSDIPNQINNKCRNQGGCILILVKNGAQDLRYIEENSLGVKSHSPRILSQMHQCRIAELTAQPTLGPQRESWERRKAQNIGSPLRTDRRWRERLVWHGSECLDSLKSLEPPPEAPVPPGSVWWVVGPACLLPGRVLTPINGDHTVPHRHPHRTEGTLSGDSLSASYLNLRQPRILLFVIKLLCLPVH